MKIRTQDQFNRILDADRIWRIREITALRSQFSATGGNSAARDALRRSFVPIAYAHWEGYVKKVGQSYLDYVATQKLKLCELSPCFQSLYFSIEFQSDLKASKRHSLQGMLKRLSMGKDDRVYIRTKDVVSTQGNLNSDTLSDICLNLGLDFKAFEKNVSFLDKILLARRNAVAHGEAVMVDAKMAEDVHKNVIECIDIFKELVVNSLDNNRFKI